MADDGDECGFHLVGIAKMRDVAHRHDDVTHLPVWREQRRIGNAHRHIWGFRPFNITFDIQMGVGSQGPAVCFSLIQRETVRFTRPLDQLIVMFSANLIISLPADSFKGVVDAFDAVVRIKNYDAVCRAVNQCVKALFFDDDLAVQPGVENRNGCLVSERLQKLLIVARK